MTIGVRKTITTSLPAAELAELDRVRERQDLSRAEAVRAAIRWYIAAVGSLPPAEEPTHAEIEVAGPNGLFDECPRAIETALTRCSTK
jgi:metal-responsive CopG/Arc/MetJ family transcriptional regulator